MHLTPQQMAQRLHNLGELEKQLTFRISRLSKLLDNHAAGTLAGTGLNLTWYRILLVLKIFGKTTAADLSRLMVIDRAQISRAMSDMIERGLVTSSPDPTSKRKKLLCLTDRGKRTMESVWPLFRERQRVLEEQINESEKAGLSASIDKLSAYLAEELELPEAIPTSVLRM